MTLDLALAAVVALFGLLGAASGAMKQLRHWAGLILAALAARPLAARLAPYATPKLGLSPAASGVVLSVVSFIVLFVAGTLAAREILGKIFPDRQGGGGDRAFGFVLGAGKGAALLFVLLSLVDYFEKPLARALGGLPAAMTQSRAVAFARRRDLFDAVPVPALAKLSKLIDAAQSPGGVKGLENQPELRRLLDDPRLKAALADGTLSRALKSGDLSALSADPRVKALLDDPRFAAALQGAK